MENEDKNVRYYISDNDFDLYLDFNNYAVLNLYVNKEDKELVELYKNHVAKHNNLLLETQFPNSGFDVFIPENVQFTENGEVKLVNLNIKTEMLYHEVIYSSKSYCAFCVEPRSSIYKTPLTLANNRGVIDSGYRGFIYTPLRLVANKPYVVEKHTRILQITHPTLCPIFVNMIEDESDLTKTERGEGGFGSTGVKGSI
jgi:dUTP pyrophosphatase